MFKDRTITEVIIYAILAALALFMIAALVDRETRPPGHECKEGETKPRAKDNFVAICSNGYWRYIAPIP